MANAAMFERLPEQPARVWRIRGELADAEEAAREYEQHLREIVGGNPGALPRLDLVLLGMGADGHTASLFPATTALYERERLVVSNRVDKLKTDRITMTAQLLNNAAQIVFLVQGAEKAEALRAVLEGPYDPDHLPAQLIHPTRGRLTWLVDDSAARLLSTPRSLELHS
jgi:6-phosphogluconolactonase